MSLLPVPSMMTNDVRYRPLTKQNKHMWSPVYYGPHDGLSGKRDIIINKGGPLGDGPGGYASDTGDAEIIITWDRGAAEGDGSASPRLDTGEALSVW